ncbi:MAG: hypothetical protein KZQ64_11625 [gamma proteobacterium symbiont of Bathyaustriella thionipta]|nr:hypothetical protein [gamma proteobacterium symbiont of Bathyaustriella thionipta]MCU7951388.1 hypothetical protein [gamma proteobacterium symbiont of Bathyaustriella thionipta]MCU7954020.1 hypothetical protein [gamma proteobacterium symbiont of Bathyaustriella thionipta]MCU7957937.1 hypothetical protein [gamma proteobacterium symbiont of Bathyaustriella thionipta]MCU7967848.1 hypothetical protein [gamma proteobacterium symbiont of Bathyaustriella thionipta]
MYCRLFFLFHDTRDAKKAVAILTQKNISITQMRTLAKPGVNLEGLPVSAPDQRRDMHTKIESFLWNFNLSLFFIALYILAMSFIFSNYFLMFGSLVVMTATYWTGYHYLTKPTIHLSGFHAAFEHNEILLMVDILKEQISQVEDIISHKNPSASKEGISWTPSDLSMNV